MNGYYVMFRVHVLHGPIPTIDQFGELIRTYKEEYPDVRDMLFRLLNSQILLRYPVSSPEDIVINRPANLDDLWVQWCKLLFLLYSEVHPRHGPNERFRELLVSHIPILRVENRDSDDDEMDVDSDSSTRTLERKKSNLREEVEVLVSTETVNVSLFELDWLQRMAVEEANCNKELEMMNLKVIAWNLIREREMALMTPLCRCTKILKLMGRTLPSMYWKKWHPYSRLAWSDAEDGPVLRAFHTLYAHWVLKITTATDLDSLHFIEEEIGDTSGVSVMFSCPRQCRSCCGTIPLPTRDVCLETIMPIAQSLAPLPDEGNLISYVDSQLHKVVRRLSGNEEYFVTHIAAAKASVLGKCYLSRIRLRHCGGEEYSEPETDPMWQPGWDRLTTKLLQLALTEPAFDAFERTVQLLGVEKPHFYRLFPISRVLGGFFHRLFVYIYESNVRKKADSRRPHVTFGLREQWAIMAYSAEFKKRWLPHVRLNWPRTCPLTGLRCRSYHSNPRWFTVGSIPEVGELPKTRNTVTINRGEAMLFARRQYQ